MANSSTVRKKRLFLEAVERGSSVTEAAAYADVRRSTVYNWRNADSTFAGEWLEIEDALVSILKAKAWNMAKGGNVRLITFLIDLHENRGDRLRAKEADEETAGEIQIYGVGTEEDPGGDFITFVETPG